MTIRQLKDQLEATPEEQLDWNVELGFDSISREIAGLEYYPNERLLVIAER